MKDTVTEVFYADVSALLNENDYDKLLGALPESIKSRVKSYKQKKDFVLSLGAWSLLCFFLSKRGITLTDDNLNFTENGKPQMKNGEKFFSLSHSFPFVAVAISSASVGVDIERVRPSTVKFSERFFSEWEREYVGSAVFSEKATVEVWTKKEAFLKAEGVGITLPLSSFSVVGKEKVKDYTFETENIKEGYVLSVCEKTSETDFIKTELTEIIK